MRENEPIPPSEVPAPPGTLDGYAREEWERVAHGLAALGILADLDRALLSAYCSAWSTFRHAEDELSKLRAGKGGELAALIHFTKAGNAIHQPLVGIRNRAASDMVKFGDLLGMGESARARLGIERSRGKPSKFAGLISPRCSGVQGGQDLGKK